MANSTLSKAKADKKDEFYTQFYDIEAEMEAYLDYNLLLSGKTQKSIKILPEAP